MGVHIPIFGIAAVARLPRKDNKKSVIASEAATWAFVQLVYCHSERSEAPSAGRRKDKNFNCLPRSGKPDYKSSNVCKKLYGKNIIPYGREIK